MTTFPPKDSLSSSSATDSSSCPPKSPGSGISVLMAVYHAVPPSYLDRSLQSIWTDQKLRPDEIILVEDGPLGDGLRAVVSKWQKEIGPKLLIIQNAQNLGLTKSLNKAIPLAHGEFLARMDSDDISLPCRFQKEKEYLENNPEIDVLGGAIQEFDDQNPCLFIRHYPLTPTTVRKSICKGNPIAHPTVMMRRRIFDSGLRYNEHYRTSQDLALWFDALAAGFKLASMEEVVLLFRRNEGVIKRRNHSYAWNELRCYFSGIYRLNGLLSYRYAYPIARYFFRFMPSSLIRSLYDSPIRHRIFRNHPSHS